MSAPHTLPDDSLAADDIDWDEAPLKACPRCDQASPVRHGYSRPDSAEMVRIQCGHCGLVGPEHFWCSMETAVAHWNGLPRLAETAAALQSGATLGAQDLTAQVAAALQAKSAARDKCARAKQAAENLRQQEESAPNRLLGQLRETYSERACELAQQAGACPRAHWGSYLDPDEVRAGEDGLTLSWDINGNYAPAWYTASWEALLSTNTDQEGSAA
jgi:hypothetical protein